MEVVPHFASVPPNSLFPLFSKANRDPAQILLELERGLRSQNSGEQCEAIMFFGKLIRTYPWPTIVNSTALKLADLYRNGNNFVRYYIWFILQGCASRMNKILNVDEVLRRIYSVLQSNDPVARSITLRTLASLPDLLHDRLNIHHGIRNCFGSSHELERQTTLFAMDKVCESSATFARGILDNLATLIEGRTAPLTTKLKLIRIFRTMHQDKQMALQARKVCTKLLTVYPSKSFVLTILDTLTYLAKKSLLDIDCQVELLFKYLFSDTRITVRLLALSNLNEIAVIVSDHSSYNLPQLFLLLQSSPYYAVQYYVLVLLNTLANRSCNFMGGLSKTEFEEAIATCETFLYQNSSTFDQTQSLVSASSPSFLPFLSKHSETIAELSAKLLSSIVVNSSGSYPGLDKRFLQSAWIAICSVHRSSDDSASFDGIISSINVVLQHNGSLCDVVGSLMIPKILSLTGEESSDGRELSGMLSVLWRKVEVLVPHLHIICEWMRSNQLLISDLSMYKLIKALFIAFRSSTTSNTMSSVTTELLPLIQDLLDRSKDWHLFRIARLAVVFGFHKIALEIFSALSLKVSSELFYFWMSGLHILSSAEFAISNDQSLSEEVLLSLYNAKDLIKAGISVTSPMGFQLSFITLKIDFLETVKQIISLLVDISSFEHDDPHNDQVSRTVKLYVSKLCKLHKEFGVLGQCYFDIDQTSLDVLEVNQMNCLVMVSLIYALVNFTDKNYRGRKFESIFKEMWEMQGGYQFEQNQNKCSGYSPFAHSFSLVAHVLLNHLGAQILPQSQEVENKSKEPKELSFWTQRVRSTIFDVLSSTSFYPPYFFRMKPGIEIKLTTSLQSSTTTKDGVVVKQGCGLVVKISGLILNHVHIKRKIKHLSLLVKKIYHENGQTTVVESENLVTPMNNSFTSSCLLDFTQCGNYTLSFSSTIIDIHNHHWKDPYLSDLCVTHLKVVP